MRSSEWAERSRRPGVAVSPSTYHNRLSLLSRRMKEALPPPLFPSPDGEQSDYANDIQDKYHNRVDAKVKELAFGAED